jgi:hypothetical protein
MIPKLTYSFLPIVQRMRPRGYKQLSKDCIENPFRIIGYVSTEHLTVSERSALGGGAGDMKGVPRSPPLDAKLRNARQTTQRTETNFRATTSPKNFKRSFGSLSIGLFGGGGCYLANLVLNQSPPASKK